MTPDAVQACAVSSFILALSMRLGWASKCGRGVSSLFIACNALCHQVWGCLVFILFPNCKGTSYFDATVASSPSLCLPLLTHWKYHVPLFCSPAMNGGISRG